MKYTRLLIIDSFKQKLIADLTCALVLIKAKLSLYPFNSIIGKEIIEHVITKTIKLSIKVKPRLNLLILRSNYFTIFNRNVVCFYLFNLIIS